MAPGCLLFAQRAGTIIVEPMNDRENENGRRVRPVQTGTCREVAGVFLKLGCISFGGPVAHLGYFREEFVAKRGWLGDAEYADLVALCQFLPGPASSQTVFALGMRRAGLPGAVTASVCFIAPSAALMILFAYGIGLGGAFGGGGWLHGLKVAAVAVVAQAVWGMGRKLCPDFPRMAIAAAAAVAVLALPGAIMQIGAMAAGAVAGRLVFRRAPVGRAGAAMDAPADSGRTRKHAGTSAAALLVFATLLVALPLAAAATQWKGVHVFDSFYRAGSLVFGGGHVVLPLLRAEVVPPGWVTDDAFLAGYGAAQAVPGPLFSFAGYLGVLITGGPFAWLGGLACLFALFLPGWLLVGGALPFWDLLRGKAWMQAAMRGANAAVVGVLLGAFYNPVWREGITGAHSVILAVVAFVLLELLRVPSWLVVALAAAAGQMWL